MEVLSVYRSAGMSAFKVRQVTREIQGRRVSEALDILNFAPLKAARLVGKTLRSAIANAEHNFELRANDLRVKEAVVGEGRSLKRFKARARGSASPILKRSSHIRIILTDEPGKDDAKAKSKGRSKGKGAKQSSKQTSKSASSKAKSAASPAPAAAPENTAAETPVQS